MCCLYRYDTQVLFTSSKWDNAEAICVGGNAGLYGPHDFAWYDDSMPYLFVSYGGGHSKAFLQCNSLFGATNDQARLEIADASKIIGAANPPVVSFQLNGDNAFWSIDAWGSMMTNSECQWYTDALGFTDEMAVGEDFGQLDLPGVILDTDEDGDVEQEVESTKKYMLRPLRSRWGGNAGDDKEARTKWGANVLQPRKHTAGHTKAPKATKSPSYTKSE